MPCVVDNADDVQIDDAALAKLAERWLHEARTAGDGSALPVPAWDADLHFFDPADPEMSAFYILLLDSLNFSFWPDDFAVRVGRCRSRVTWLMGITRWQRV